MPSNLNVWIVTSGGAGVETTTLGLFKSAKGATDECDETMRGTYPNDAWTNTRNEPRDKVFTCKDKWVRREKRQVRK